MNPTSLLPFKNDFSTPRLKVLRRLCSGSSDLWYVFVPEALVVIACGVVVPILLFKLFRRYRVTRVMFGL